MPITEEWFSYWFGSPYYPLLYQHRDEQEAEQFLCWLMASLKKEKSSQILDLACGRGRHARYLNSQGYEVQGWDISEESIADAKRYETDTLKFEVHDMRKPFLSSKFDIILNLFTSFGYFENVSENELVLNNIHDALTSNGRFVIDFLNPNYIIPRLVPYEEKTIDNIIFKIKRYIYKEFIVKEIYVYDNKNIHKFKEKVQIFTYSDFIYMLNKAGFVPIDSFGDYLGSPFHSENSPRIIISSSK